LSLLASLSLAEALPLRLGSASTTRKDRHAPRSRAVVADLRFFQGFLASLTEEAEGSNLEPFEDHLYRFSPASSRVLRYLPEGHQRSGPWAESASLLADPPHRRSVPEHLCPPHRLPGLWAEELASLEVAWSATDLYAVTGPGIETACWLLQCCQRGYEL
jgi:hypothetical protein